MTLSFGHHELHNRYIFEGEIVLVTPLSLSSGRASDETDAPLMRRRDRTPYIPGSSLRGVLRSEVERIVAAAGTSVGLHSCILFVQDDRESACITVSRSKQNKVNELENEYVTDYVKDNLCHVCLLFGSTVYASKVVIFDLYPSKPDSYLEHSIIRDGVGIDRDTGRASDQVKFDYEVLETGPIFAFKMQVENVTDQDRKILNLMLGMLKQGVQVGGKRAAGLGEIKLLPDSLKVRGFESHQGLCEALMRGEDPHGVLSWEGISTC